MPNWTSMLTGKRAGGAHMITTRSWPARLALILVAVLVPRTALALPEGSSPFARIAFENEHVRVVEVLASPGATRPMHLQVPGVLVSLSKTRFEMTNSDGKVSVVDYNEGQTTWQGSAEQRAWRLVAGQAHAFFVEIKSAMSGEVPTNPPLEPSHSTIIDPDKHHLVLDNQHVRVIDGFGPAGSRSDPHTHPPTVLVSLRKSRFRVTINGRTRIFDFEPAAVRWTNHFEHTWQNIAGDGQVVMVEIKSAHGDPAFRRR